MGMFDDLMPGNTAAAGTGMFDDLPKVKPRTFGEAAKDIGVGLLQGGARLVKSGGDLHGLATGRMDNTASTLGGNAQQYWEEAKSAPLREKIATRKQDIDAQDGLLGKAWVGLKDTVTDPALAIDTVTSNAASFLPSAIGGRAAYGAKLASGMNAASKVGPVGMATREALSKQAGNFGTNTAIGIGAVQQGTNIASNTYDEALKKPDAVWDANPEFNARLQSNGGDREAAKQELALQAARITLPAAGAISLVANKVIPGASMLERALVGGAARDTLQAGVKFALPKAIAKGALGSAGEEAIEEGGGQFAGNVVQQRIIDPSQDLSAGVGENAGLGAAGGLLMGGIGGAFHRQAATPEIGQTPTPVPTIDPAVAPAVDPAIAPASAAPPGLGFNPNAGTHTVFPDGSVILNSDQPAGEQAVFDRRYAPRPAPTPAEAMGLDPNAGTLSAAATVAVNSGAYQPIATATQSLPPTAKADDAFTQPSQPTATQAPPAQTPVAGAVDALPATPAGDQAGAGAVQAAGLDSKPNQPTSQAAPAQAAINSIAENQPDSPASTVQPGESIGTVTYANGKTNTDVKVESVQPDGSLVLTGKRGVAKSRTTVSPKQLQEAIGRAQAEGKRKAAAPAVAPPPPPPPRPPRPPPPPLTRAESIQSGPAVVLQNRDRSSVSSIEQMNEIAANPDFLRTGAARVMETGAPVAFGDIPSSAAIGRTEQISDGKGQRVQVQYAVVEASDVLTSNRADGTSVSEYAQGQPGKMRAVAGNGRAAGVTEAYRRGTATNYRADLTQDADALGIDPAAIAAMQSPVLIRMMDSRDVTADIGDRSNIAGAAKLSAVEQARTDARRVEMSTLEFDEFGEPTPDSIKQFTAGMPTSERGELLNRDGSPTRQAIDRLMAATFKQAYGSDELVQLYAQATDVEARTVMSALADAAGAMAGLSEAGDLDIRGAVAEAAGMAVNARRRGMKLADMLKTNDITASGEALVIARFFANNIRSGKRIAKGLRDWATYAARQAQIARDNKVQGRMFGQTPVASRADIFNRIENEQRQQQEEGAPQPARIRASKDGTGRPQDQPLTGQAGARLVAAAVESPAGQEQGLAAPIKVEAKPSTADTNAQAVAAIAAEAENRFEKKPYINPYQAEQGTFTKTSQGFQRLGEIFEGTKPQQQTTEQKQAYLAAKQHFQGMEYDPANPSSIDQWVAAQNALNVALHNALDSKAGNKSQLATRLTVNLFQKDIDSGRAALLDLQQRRKGARGEKRVDLDGQITRLQAMLKELEVDGQNQDGSDLTAPTKADIPAQQTRQDTAQADEQRRQIDREREAADQREGGFMQQPTAPEQRGDNTGDMFGGPSVADVQAAADAKAKSRATDGGAGLFDAKAAPTAKSSNNLDKKSTARIFTELGRFKQKVLKLYRAGELEKSIAEMAAKAFEKIDSAQKQFDDRGYEGDDAARQSAKSALVLVQELVRLEPRLEYDQADYSSMRGEGNKAPTSPADAPLFGTSGDFGPTLTQYKGDAQGAIRALRELQNGEAVAALNHPEVGDIDLVWGKPGTNKHDGFGLSKLVKWHPEVLADLQAMVESMKVTQRSENRVQLESKTHKGAVRLQWDGKSKHWLMTAFEKDVDAASPRTDTTDKQGKGDSLSGIHNKIVDEPAVGDKSKNTKADIRKSFAGPKAQTAERLNLLSAQRQITEGADPETVRQDTGWHRGIDGRWRFEISDDQASVQPTTTGTTFGSIHSNAQLANDSTTGLTVGDVLAHDQLYAAYPGLKDIPLGLIPQGQTATAQLTRFPDGRHEVKLAGRVPRADIASAILHELQHAIQNIEGFAQGGSKRTPVVANIDQQAQQTQSRDLRERRGASAYARLAGEIEARNTQARQSMTDMERSAIAPEFTTDMADSQAIVTFNGRDVVNAPPPENAPAPPAAIPMTASRLKRAFAVQFPKLSPAIDRMLERGAKGQKGGVVVISSNESLDIARVFTEKTGRNFSESVQLFSDAGQINGFFDPRTGLTFLIGPNLDPITGVAVLLHEISHGQQRQGIDKRAMAMLENRAKEPNPGTRAFLNRVADRMENAGETGNAKEAAAYIVEQAVQEGRSEGFTVANGQFLAWVDKTLGKAVGDLIRSTLANVRAWQLRHGMAIGEISVDDLVGYAMVGAQRAAAGRVLVRAEKAKAAFSRSADNQAETPAFKAWYGEWQNAGKGDAANADIRFSRESTSEASTHNNIARQAINTLNEAFASAPGKVSWWHTTIGSMYNLAERDPAFKRVFDAGQNFLGDVAYYGTQAADMAPTILPKMETLADMSKQPISHADNRAIAAPIFQGTLSWMRDENGKPVRTDSVQAAGIVWTDAELVSLFSATPEQIKLYKETRAAIDLSLDNAAKAEMLRYAGKDAADLKARVMDAPDVETAAQVLQSLFLQMAKDNPARADSLKEVAESVMERAEKISGLKAKGYAPLSRFGRFTVDAVVDGKREYFSMFESARDANRMAERLGALYGKANVSQGTISEREFEQFQGVTPESMELFGNMLGLESTGDKAQDQAFQEYLKRAKNNKSAMKRLIHREGIAGYSEDVGRALASFVYSNARQTAAALHMGDMVKAVADIPKQQGELKDVAIGLSEYIKKPREEAQMVRSLMFAQYIGGSVASAMVNMTQPMTVSMPYLSQFGGAAQATAQLVRAAKDMATRGLVYEPGLKQALATAEDRGIVSPQEVHQLMAQARGAASLQSGDGTRAGDARAAMGNGLTRLSLGWGKLFGAAEQANRRATFIAAFRIAVAQGMQNPTAFAEKTVNETQFVNNRGNKMRWGRGAVGATLMTFKSYSINYLELLNRMWSQGGPEGKKAAALMVAVLLLTAGAGGLPFVDDVSDVLDFAGQRMGYNFSSKKARQEFLEDVFGKAGADFIDRGLTGIPGVPIDISGRMGMGNLIPGTGLLLQKRDRTNDLKEIVGPVGDMVQRAFRAGDQALDGELFKAVMTTMPKAVSNAWHGFDMADKDMYRDRKGAKVIETTMGEAVMKGIGFQPQTVSKIQEANGILMVQKAQYQQTASKIRTQWARGVFEKNTDTINSARQRLARWNERNPDQRIVVNMADVMKKAREMNKSKDERLAQTAPKVMRQQTREFAQGVRAGF